MPDLNKHSRQPDERIGVHCLGQRLADAFGPLSLKKLFPSDYFVIIYTDFGKKKKEKNFLMCYVMSFA